jgi:hypothetical protein
MRELPNASTTTPSSSDDKMDAMLPVTGTLAALIILLVILVGTRVSEMTAITGNGLHHRASPIAPWHLVASR